MIYIKLTRGVGNQLFQLAFGYILQLKFNDGLCFDDSEGTSYGVVRGLENGKKSPISSFKISDGFIATQKFNCRIELKFILLKVYSFIIRVIPKLLNNKDLQLKIEHITSPLLNKKGYFYSQLGYVPVYYTYKGKDKIAYGNFMSSKYWGEYKDLIYHVIKDNIKSYNSSYLKEIRNTNAVCIHVRKGDYCDKRYKMLDVCDSSYYENAIKIMKEKIENPTFFVFSNDFKWCEEYLKGIDAQIVFVVENSERKPLQDLFLMSNCKNYIISNSSFSWWGQFLSDNNNNKIVIAPRNFVKGKHNHSLAQGLIEETWVLV